MTPPPEASRGDGDGAAGAPNGAGQPEGLALPARAAAPRPTLRGAVTLRLRLTLLSTGLAGLMLVFFGVLVYFWLERTLSLELDRALTDRASVALRSMSVSVGPGGGLRVEPPDVDAISAGGAVMQAVLLNGDVVRSQSLGQMTLPVSHAAQDAARRNRPLFETVRLTGQDLRLFDAPIVFENRAIGVLQVARPLETNQQTLARLRFVLLAGGAGSLLVCGLLSLAVARAALRPVERLTREAEEIGSARGFGERVSARAAGRNDEIGRLAAAFNAMLDRLQRAYAALQDANGRLEAALESQRRFVADASHELRTPLTTVRGNASLLRRYDSLTPEDRTATVEQIVAESERMSRLVGDLLTLARADAGQLLQRKPVPLGPLVDDVAYQARVLAGGKVAVSVVRTADVTTLGDSDALRQLLLILVDNAIKYTPAGGSVTLGVRVDSGQGGDHLARVSVVDTGVGIAPADLPHIFDRFYRADRARKAGGTGLGLSIGKWIAEAHGGSIAVESSPGAGSIFTVTLPALKEPAGRIAPAADPLAAAAR